MKILHSIAFMLKREKYITGRLIRVMRVSFVMVLFVLGVTAGSASANMNITQTLSDEAQRTTIAFDGLTFLTGDLCSDSFLPPGKVADFFGFQYLRDNDPSGIGHSPDFLTRIANNMLFLMNQTQKDELIAMAVAQVSMINQYAYDRFPLMKAFRRLLIGDIPTGSNGLDRTAVINYSAELYQLDGQLSFQRAALFAKTLNAVNQTALSALRDLALTQGVAFFPNLPNQIDPQSLSHDVHVAVMTYASEMFSWYAGSLEADTYFCPERQGTYFGSFYLKDMPAMGNPGYIIDSNLTANKGREFLAALTDIQAAKVTGLVDLQRSYLYEIVTIREAIAQELRRFMTDGTANEATVQSQVKRYGELDGEIVYLYATHFTEVGQTVTGTQMENLMGIRDLEEFPCNGAYLYSENIAMPVIINTDFLFIGTEPPLPPINVSASDGTYGDKVQVTWTASLGASSYTVYRATSTNRWSRKTTLGTTSEAYFNDTTAVPRRTYYYWVKASNAYGTSDFSVYDTGYRFFGSSLPPTNLSASDGT